MNVWLSGYTLALGGIVLAWIGISAYVIATRALFDLGNLSFHTGRRVLDRRLARGLDATAALRGLPRRTLAGIAADAATPPEIAKEAAEQLLERRFGRVIGNARSHRSETHKWRRIASLRILSVSGWAIAAPLLEAALADPDADVSGAAIGILGGRTDRRSAAALLNALRRGTHSRSRIAAQLDRFHGMIATDLIELLEDPEPSVRQWAATLLARYDDPSVELELAALIVDEDPQVRAAVLKGLAGNHRRLATPAAVAALKDPVWFVRVHAARALGQLGRSEFAEGVISMLSDERWWVRSAAQDSLVGMGTDASPLVVNALQSNDEFVRNGAAQILQDTGVLDELVAQLGTQPADELAERMVQKIFAAGGHRLAEAAVQRAGSASAGRARDFLAEFATQPS